jgi:hypothetical protein
VVVRSGEKWANCDSSARQSGAIGAEYSMQIGV